MNNKYVVPKLKLDAFNCPYCGAYSNMTWFELHFTQKGGYDYGALGFDLQGARCSRCNQLSIWNNEEMIIPANSTAPMPNEDMPESVKELYEEARGIVNKSPRGAVALLRLALDKLCDEIDVECRQPKYNGKISDKIGILVKKGLSEQLQQAFDFVRVTGNDAVHELGIIDVQDNPEIATALFGLLNFIVEKMITEKKQIAGLYSLIPESRRNKIKERNDSVTQST